MKEEQKELTEQNPESTKQDTNQQSEAKVEKKKIRKMYTTRNEGNFDNSVTINGIEYEKVNDLRYGDNPNQAAAFYRPKSRGCFFGEMKELKSGKNGLSMTNLADIHHAINILKYFDEPACAVMKHLNPSGVAIQYNNNSLKEIYVGARDSDARSAFGSVVGFNRPLDKQTAEEINTTFVECVFAPRFENGVLEEFNKKKSLRVIEVDFVGKLPCYKGEDVKGYMEIKKVGLGSYVFQEPYLSSMRTIDHLIPAYASKKKEGKIECLTQLTPDVASDLLFAWKVNLGVRSNGVVFAKQGRTIAIGTGEQERVGAIEKAMNKANSKHPGELKGCVLASDGFFPFRDSIDLVKDYGIAGIIQPGGSVNDYEVIQACNEHNIPMVFTGERCFGHF